MGSFGERLKTIRLEKAISVVDFASSIGMTRDAVLKLENGSRGRTLEKLPAIAKALGCRIDDLFPEMDGYIPPTEEPQPVHDSPAQPEDSRNAAPAADTDAHAPTGDAAPVVPSKPTTAALDADNWWELLGLEL